MSLPKEQFYTIDDIYNLPDGTRAELIDGQIYMMAPPNRMHQEISMQLTKTIANYIDKHNGSCKVYSAPFAVFLNDNDETYLEPDICVICDPGKLNDKGCAGAPDLIMEITSPSTAKYDYGLKLSKYIYADVREYWIINPQKHAVTVYDFSDDNFIPQLFTFQDKIKVNIYGDFYIDFQEIVA